MKNFEDFYKIKIYKIKIENKENKKTELRCILRFIYDRKCTFFTDGNTNSNQSTKKVAKLFLL